MKLIHLTAVALPLSSAQWNPLNDECLHFCYSSVQPETASCSNSDNLLLENMISCAQTECPATASSLTVSSLADPEALLAPLHVTISPKEQYSCQNSLVPNTGNDPHQDNLTLSLNGTGACLTSPYLFRSIVPRAVGLSGADGICQIEIFNLEDCQGDTASSVEVGGEPAADGQCVFQGGRSASLKCDLSLLIQTLQNGAVNDIDTQAKSYFHSQCHLASNPASGAAAQLARPQGYNYTNSTRPTPSTYGAGTVSTTYSTGSAHSTETADSTDNSSSSSTAYPTSVSTNMALEERSPSHSLVALMAGLFVATAIL